MPNNLIHFEQFLFCVNQTFLRLRMTKKYSWQVESSSFLIYVNKYSVNK